MLIKFKIMITMLKVMTMALVTMLKIMMTVVTPFQASLQLLVVCLDQDNEGGGNLFLSYLSRWQKFHPETTIWFCDPPDDPSDPLDNPLDNSIDGMIQLIIP